MAPEKRWSTTDYPYKKELVDQCCCSDSEGLEYCPLFELQIQIPLFKLYNANENNDWTLLNFNQTFTSRQTTFTILRSNLTKINIVANRLSIINGKIPFTWLND